MSCSSTPHNFDVQFFFNKDCFNCGDNGCGSNIQNSKCVIYTGPNLSCSGVETNDSIELALQKIDAQICSAIGDYSNYQFNCLLDYWGSSITQESTFVDAITSFACLIRTDLNNFTGATFPDYQTAVDTRFIALEVPGITCSSAGVSPTDTLQVVLAAYCTKFESIDTALDISGVVWNNCYTVPSPPTTISGGFDVVLSQICQLKNDSATLPTFNNVGSCLASPGSADSLVDTVEKIKTRLCQSPTLDNANLSSSCLTIPGTATDLEGLLQAIIDKVDVFTQNAPSYSGDFTVNPNGGPCDGVTIALATPINQDRFVAANNADGSPGTLIAKLVGVGVTVDDTTNAGQITLTVTSTDNYTVKADSSDTTPGYLDEKLQGGTDSGITIGIGYDGGSEKATVTPVVDMSTLAGAIMTFIGGDALLQSQLCALVAPCIGANCYTYSVSNSTGDTVTVTYSDCASSLPISTPLNDGGNISVCAKFGTVSAPGCTITPVAACVPGGGGGGGVGTKNVFVVNNTGSYISMTFDAGSQAFGPGMNGNIALTPGGFLTNTSGTWQYTFITTMPSTTDPDESPNPETLGSGSSHTLNADLSNLNYIVVTVAP